MFFLSLKSFQDRLIFENCNSSVISSRNLAQPPPLAVTIKGNLGRADGKDGDGQDGKDGGGKKSNMTLMVRMATMARMVTMATTTTYWPLAARGNIINAA